MGNEVNPRVVNRINKSLAEALAGNKLETVALKDGQGHCPGCNREVQVPQAMHDAVVLSLPVECPNCHKEFRIVQDSRDESEDMGVMYVPESEVLKFFLEHQNPTDKAFHEFCEEKGWNKHQAEAVAYRFATRYAKFRTGGVSKGKRPSDLIAEEESMGQTVEYEHTSNPEDALKIAWDHLAEVPNSKYYTFLDAIERVLKAGPDHDLYKKMEKLAEEAGELPSEH